MKILTPLFLLGLTFLATSASCAPPADDAVQNISSSNVATTDETRNPDLLARFADDYPFWRGTTRDDVCNDSTVAPLKWSETENIVWKTPLPGSGHGTPTIVGDRIFVPIGEKNGEQITVSILILERSSGKILQKTPLATGESQRIHGDNSWASQTAACDGERLFYSFQLDAEVFLYCCDLNGKILWKRNLGSNKAFHGYAQSPLIYKDRVVVCNDSQGEAGRLVAFEAKTGEIVWETPRPNNREGCYSSPVLIHSSGKDQIILNTCDAKIISYNPQDGSVFWFVQTKSQMGVSSASWDDSFVYVSEAYPQKILNCIRTDGSGDVTEKNLVWSKRRAPTPSYVPSLALKDSRLYCLADQGEIACVDAETGDSIWKDSLEENIYSSPVLVGDKVYCFGRRGTAWIYRTGDKLERIAENKLDSGVWATPVFLDGGIYLRSLDSLYFIKSNP